MSDGNIVNIEDIDQKILDVIETLKHNINSGKFDEETKGEILDILTSYNENKYYMDPTLIKYLCTGFMVHKLLMDNS